MKLHTIRFFLALVVFLHLPSWADEMSERRAITDYVENSFKNEDFSAIEQRYAELYRKTERFPSGVLKSARVLYGIRSAQWVAAYDPKKSPAEREAQAHADYTAMEERLARWQRAFPASSLAAFALSNAYISHAFLYRGGGFAAEVKPEKWKYFEDYIGRAFKALTAPEVMKKKDAVWYSAMLALGQYTSWDTDSFMKLVDEASDAYPQFYEIYFFAAPRFKPKWGGSVEAFEWLANLAVRKTRSSEGMALYARIYWSLGQGDYKDDLFSATRANWPKMKAGFEDILRQYPDVWNLNNYAWFACQAKDGKKLKELFGRLGANLNTSLWASPARLNRCRSLADESE